MQEIGSLVGMAFQIKDDLFDYGDEKIGKPLGIDIREKKVTLPLIHALSKASWLEKRRILKLVRDAEDKPGNVEEVVRFVRDNGGLDHAKKVMDQFRYQAVELLNSLPDTPHRHSLQLMIDYTISRNK